MQVVEKHNFGAETGKILRLMIHSLYTNRDIFLRELVSNASDACEKLRYESITEPSLAGDGKELRINLSYDKGARTLTVSDNGIGMSHDELIANLGTIARSGTQEFLNSLTGDKGKDATLIGQFGVGFYSVFMVADRVAVTSCKAGETEGWTWESDGEGEFTLTRAENAVRGTCIMLHLKEGEDAYLDPFRLRHVVQTYSDHIAFPIELEGETLNRASALWTRPKAEVTPEQYKEFYHHVAHQPDEPWLTLHHKAEGKIEFTSLLFIPGMKPFDLFHPDRKRRVKLYVKRVFITDEGIELVPHWLRFLRGVVDSEDLPLNISRETLQSNPVLTRIREAVVKKVLSELKKRGAQDEADYRKFWSNFGAVVKEGLCEANAPREALLEVCRFSTTDDSGLTSLDDYIARMKPGQEHLYFLTGERKESLLSSPQLEGFRDRGIEVLLMHDHVDDFWLSVVSDYKGKLFKSVTRADIDLSSFERKEGEKPEESNESADADRIATRFREVLGDQVRDVRITHKLTESPVCLAIPEGAMDMRLERFLLEQKQLAAGMPKILEINPQHPVLSELDKKLDDARAQNEIADVIWLLFDQAKIAEGEEVTDAAAFARRLNHFMRKGLAA